METMLHLTLYEAIIIDPKNIHIVQSIYKI